MAQAGFRRRRGAGLLVAALVLGSCSRPPAPPAQKTEKAAPPGTIGQVHLIDEEGRPFGAEQLRGRVWIAAFMFTSCPMECPILSQRMSYVQKLLAGKSPSIRLLSISVNPKDDTPPVLKEYGARFHRDPARWTLLTGDTEPLLKAVSDDYDRVAPAGRPGKRGGFEALHGDNLLLIDGEGRIRGYYRKDDAEVRRLLADADRVANGEKS
jgi:protein SCO1/2